MTLMLTDEEKVCLRENLEYIISLFCDAHEELKKYCSNLSEEILSKYFEYSYERTIFFSPEGAIDTYHNYYCFVFATIMKSIFPEFNFYARFDEEHVAIGESDYIFDICGIYKSKNGEFRDMEDAEYFDATNDDDFLFDLNHYFSKLNKDLENKLRELFYRKVREFLESKIISNKHSRTLISTKLCR